MSAQAVQGSPTKANRIPNHSNLRAKQDHLNTDLAITPRTMDGYIDDAKKFLAKRANEAHWRGPHAPWKAISLDPGVQHAYAVLKPILKNNDEKTHYAPTTQLLNCISLAVYKLLRHKERRDCAHIFASNSESTPGGGIGGERYRPDYISYLGKLSELEGAVKEVDHRCELPWHEIGHVGEDKAPKQDNDGMAQLKSYLRLLKEHRPDVPTVHGFKVYKGDITFVMLNACDMWTTTGIDCSKLDPWIAYVVMLYSLHGMKDRNPDLRYNAQQPDFVRWDVVASASPRRQEYALSPFYSSRAPGRATFASFQVSAGPTSHAAASEAYFVHDVKGFWKLSWQQTSARSKEKDLLQLLHSEGWLPGLVRLHDNDDVYTEMKVSAGTKPTQDRSDASAEPTPAPQSTPADSTPAPQSTAADSAPAPQPKAASDRILEILHLASIGEPLSQLESPRALIHAFYDLLETLIHMYERGVLHRDVSWFNVLYKGKHYRSNGRAVLKRPCIEEIMHGLHSSNDTEPSTSQSKEFSPCILVTDLDHAIKRELLENNAKAGREKTGTPMFMAVELSDYSGRKYRAGFIPDLKRAVEATNTLSEDALLLAFPNGDNGFMTKFLAVMKAERLRDDAYPLTSKPVHRPRHDAESAFWVFFWAAIRALPQNTSLQPSAVDIDEFSNFCKTMLDHIVAGDVADQRSKILKADEFDRLFHPALKPLVGLFETMALYLTVPWHYYEDKKMVDPDHAHVAFRRLLLRLELDLERDNPAMLALRLNTEHPRVIAPNVVDNAERGSARLASRMSHVRASGRESELSGFPETGDSTSSKKRKANEPNDGGAGTSKRPAAKTAAASETAQFSTPDSAAQCAPASDYSTVAGVTYDESVHLDRITAHVLRLKFKKDRQLWFSRGE